MALFGLVAVGMAGVLAGSLKGVALGRQRSVATADANLVLEQARSLHWSDVGLASDDATLDSDPDITTATPTERTFDAEPIVFAQSTASHPFKPHIQTVDRSPSTLTRNIYVTGVDTTADGQYDVKRVTVVVSWARSAVGGVANRVTASTIISANSPGTPGNPPLSSVCTGCPTPTPPPFPPISGFTAARSANATLRADVGSGADLFGAGRPVAEIALTGVNGNGSNVLDAASKVACAEQYATVRGTLAGVLTAGTSGAAAANTADSVTNPGPHTDSSTQNETTAAIPANPLAVGQASLAGTVSCTSSGITSGATLPYGSGTGSLQNLTVSASTAAAPLTAPLAGFDLLNLSSETADQSVTQSTPADKQMTAIATTGITDLKILNQTGIVAGVLNLGAPEGLVRITGFEATATASSTSSTGSRSVAVDPAKPLTIKVWDGGSATNLTDQNGGAITCDSRSGSYCVLSPSLTTGRIVRQDRDVCLALLIVCLVNVHIEVTVTINPAVTTTTTLSDQITKVYRAEYTPVTINARIYANNDGSTTRLVDLASDVDLGRVLACAKYGPMNGGCS